MKKSELTYPAGFKAKSRKYFKKKGICFTVGPEDEAFMLKHDSVRIFEEESGITEIIVSLSQLERYVIRGKPYCGYRVI